MKDQVPRGQIQLAVACWLWGGSRFGALGDSCFGGTTPPFDLFGLRLTGEIAIDCSPALPDIFRNAVVLLNERTAFLHRDGLIIEITNHIGLLLSDTGNDPCNQDRTNGADR